MSGDRTAYAKAVLVWRWQDAPPRLQRLFNLPGVWLLVVPKDGVVPDWALAPASDDFGRLEEYPLADGDRCIAAYRVDRQVPLPL